MELKELRIGNYIDLGNRIAKVAEIWSNAIVAFDIEETQDTVEDLERLKPIQLTEEWVYKAGFKKFEYTISLNDGQCYHYELNNDGRDWVLFFNGMWFTINEAKMMGKHFRHNRYLHQLQNAWFSITGSELTIV